ncbi:TOTE conflict system archaeo-eukaryotic primase domain-containing protein [Tuanshanicoccus lijuaniae]|uniref:TOTE conflict system archaeo-eukaryotic primase domain-containing protein n=1 Tax=Aerococcaceae bacterium zg-1292 TaxID=2774330 RepID=UPI001BD8597F|nr:DEAD/DEAH box helicase family protein [Aerococcaceae bacterium zg-A91]MBS4457714.1 DEAD/DEAH box helicase family protein [Aerococcaceae bacterium zg-BR33]
MVYFIEKVSGRRIKFLKTFPCYQKELILYLVEYVDNGNQILCSAAELREYFYKEEQQWTTEKKLSLYMSLFRGREDVFAKSFINDQGKIQYYPSYNYGWRKLPVEKRTTQPFNRKVLKSHLRGETSIGIFPISLDDTCQFLVIDLDEADFREATLALWKVAEQYDINPAVEISRSGQGVHLWFFFDEPILCRDARNFGKKLLELALCVSDKIKFSSFDRLFPNQDRLPKGGFGNLIALPLQGKSYQEDKTVFVNKKFNAYPNQWDYLSKIKKITYDEIDKVIHTDSPKQSVSGTFSVTLSNQISFLKRELTPSEKFQLQKLASFSNPEFYLKQAMRQTTYNVPERIYLFEETDLELKLPRGLLNEIQKSFELEITDKRISTPVIKVKFNGQLSFEQELALFDLVNHDNGILQAETGFGKTVLASALIAQRQCRTIILVHNTQLLEQWLERLDTFLDFDEEKAVRYTPSGREKIIGFVGQYYSNKKWRSKLVDVIMVQSLFNQDKLSILLDDYDMMIVDECHHVSALQFEQVIAKFSGKYLYGLTATPERKNGHEPIIFQRIGPIIHTASKRQVDFDKYLNLNFTSFGKFDSTRQLSTNFIELSEQLSMDEERNSQIVEEINAAYQLGRKVLVITNRVNHIELLQQQLEAKGINNIWNVCGKSNNNKRQQMLYEINSLKDNKAFVLISTGKYIGEGFDLPQLDTLVLAAPLSWKNNLIQYAGRIHRSYDGKVNVQIIDFVDIHVPYLEKMFHRRQVAYRKMDYRLSQTTQDQTIFDSSTYYKMIIEEMKKGSQILICTRWVSSQLLEQLISLDEKCQIKVIHSKKQTVRLNNIPNVNMIATDNRIVDTIVIINQSVVWYGSNLLQDRVKEEESFILRLENKELVKEFLAKISEVTQQ